MSVSSPWRHLFPFTHTLFLDVWCSRPFACAHADLCPVSVTPHPSVHDYSPLILAYSKSLFYICCVCMCVENAQQEHIRLERNVVRRVFVFFSLTIMQMSWVLVLVWSVCTRVRFVFVHVLLTLSDCAVLIPLHTYIIALFCACERTAVHLLRFLFKHVFCSCACFLPQSSVTLITLELHASISTLLFNSLGTFIVCVYYGKKNPLWALTMVPIYARFLL